ncbi:magnesium transporter CorA family protein [Sphingomonas jaspsi]|uniref:magnesium transporter CorA family protein n=1 Tax=Sphingomonas jaspsi TaxID=392409 RepID=UPI00055DBDE4|nr:magnesium transporter CorA family protein [Sphingomonas jaspsi]
MLRLFGPGCPAAPVDPAKLSAADCAAVWIDLLEPTKDEERWTEQLIGQNVPTREEMLEIEPSSRLYEREGVMFMTMSVLYGVDEGEPSSDPVTFILTDTHLVTLRYIDPKPFVVLADQVYADPMQAAKPIRAMMRILDAVVDRLADELEAAGRELKNISSQIFDRGARSTRRNPELRYEALMLRIGAAQRLLAKVRETSVSTSRVLTFLRSCDGVQQHDSSLRHINSLIEDAHALDDHSNFLGDNLTFLLDASLGMISLEQNFVMKIFSVVAVVLMPPTLVAGVYGMNFKYMPELEWLHGYPFALSLMLASAVLPYLIARRKGWL